MYRLLGDSEKSEAIGFARLPAEIREDIILKALQSHDQGSFAAKGKEYGQVLVVRFFNSVANLIDAGGTLPNDLEWPLECIVRRIKLGQEYMARGRLERPREVTVADWESRSKRVERYLSAMITVLDHLLQEAKSRARILDRQRVERKRSLSQDTHSEAWICELHGLMRNGDRDRTPS